MSKIKIRCSQCGKSFKSTNPRQLICPECEEKARRERAAKAKGVVAPVSTPAPATRPIASAKPAKPAAPPAQAKQHWLDKQPDVKIAAPEPPEPTRPPRLNPPERQPLASPSTSGAVVSGTKPGTPPAAPGYPRQPEARHAGASGAAVTHDHHPRKSDQQKKGDGERPKAARRVAAPPKPRREPRQPTPPFAPTAEQIAAIEQRYLELAHPTEFDGIRTQISQELGIPKSAVKKAVRALRERQDMPSWWDAQAYHGSPEDLERIRASYVPFLPTPPLGVHKQLAAQLELPAGAVYQAIKVIRAEMNLPQYNPPEEHGASPAAPQALAQDEARRS